MLNRRGGRLPVRGASNVITTIAANAGLDDGITAPVGRHTFASLPVSAAAPASSSPTYSATLASIAAAPTPAPPRGDRAKALNLLPTDR